MLLLPLLLSAITVSTLSQPRPNRKRLNVRNRRCAEKSLSFVRRARGGMTLKDPIVRACIASAAKLEGEINEKGLIVTREADFSKVNVDLDDDLLENCPGLIAYESLDKSATKEQVAYALATKSQHIMEKAPPSVPANPTTVIREEIPHPLGATALRDMAGDERTSLYKMGPDYFSNLINHASSSATIRLGDPYGRDGAAAEGSPYSQRLPKLAAPPAATLSGLAPPPGAPFQQEFEMISQGISTGGRPQCGPSLPSIGAPPPIQLPQPAGEEVLKGLAAPSPSQLSSSSTRPPPRRGARIQPTFPFPGVAQPPFRCVPPSGWTSQSGVIQAGGGESMWKRRKMLMVGAADDIKRMAKRRRSSATTIRRRAGGGDAGSGVVGGRGCSSGKREEDDEEDEEEEKEEEEEEDRREGEGAESGSPYAPVLNVSQLSRSTCCCVLSSLNELWTVEGLRKCKDLLDYLERNLGKTRCACWRGGDPNRLDQRSRYAILEDMLLTPDQNATIELAKEAARAKLPELSLDDLISRGFSPADATRLVQLSLSLLKEGGEGGGGGKDKAAIAAAAAADNSFKHDIHGVDSERSIPSTIATEMGYVSIPHHVKRRGGEGGGGGEEEEGDGIEGGRVESTSSRDWELLQQQQQQQLHADDEEDEDGEDFIPVGQHPAVGEKGKVGSSGRESAIGTVHVRAFHILVKHKDAKNPVSRQDPTGAAIQSRTIEEAHEILQTLKAAMLQTTNSGTSSSGGKVDLATFKQIAMEVSDCDTSSRQGGDMGHIYRGQIMKEFEDAAFGLEVGAISGPIESPVGVHIIYRAE
eukprot:jgi/Bigna1/70204/fgenesh1_pg.11_\